MEDGTLIRPATEVDSARLGELKFNYVHQIYHAVTPQQVMDAISQPSCEARVRELILDEHICVDVIEEKGSVVGFAAYGRDPDHEGWGLLYDTLYLNRSDIDLHHMLLRHIVEQMAKMGMDHVHAWTLRNHYRARYLYELFGFRTDGGKSSLTQGENEYQLIRYQYPTE